MLKTLKIVSLTAIAYYFWILPANAQIFVGQGEGSAWTATGPTSNNDTLHQNMDIPGYNYVGKTADGQMVWERIEPAGSGGSTPTPNPDNGTNNPTTDNPTTPTTDSDCEVKQSGDDYTYCCKEEEPVAPNPEPDTVTPQATSSCSGKTLTPGSSASCGEGQSVSWLNDSHTCYECNYVSCQNCGSCTGDTTKYAFSWINQLNPYEAKLWHEKGGIKMAINCSGKYYCGCIRFPKGSGADTQILQTQDGFDGGSSGPIQFQGDAIR